MLLPLLFLFNIMSVQTWGQLNKSQIDSTLIEERVSEMIQEHDDDPDAHLDNGQALTSHRAAEIIDHRAYSIVEDKIATGEISSRCITSNQIVGKDIRTVANVGVSADGVKLTSQGLEMWQSGTRKVNIPASGSPEFYGVVTASEFRMSYDFYTTDFRTVDDFNIYGTGSIDNYFRAKGCASGSNNGDLKAMQLYDSDSSFFDSDNYSFIMELEAEIFADSSKEIWFGINVDGVGFANLGDPDSGIAFRVANGKLYGAYAQQNTDPVFFELYSAFPTGFHTFKIVFLPGQNIKWYVDDVLKYTRSVSLPNIYASYPFGVGCKKISGASNTALVMRNLILQRIP